MSDKNELQQAREIINEVDKQIAVLFEKRMNAAKQVADYKKKNGLPVEDTDREKALVQKMLGFIENEELKTYYIGFMNNTMELSKAYQRRLLDGMKVAFSGVKGAFADIAVKGKYMLMPMATTLNKQVDYQMEHLNTGNKVKIALM